MSGLPKRAFAELFSRRNFGTDLKGKCVAATICLLFGLLLCAETVSAAAISTPKNPISAKECAICHYRWVDTFFIEGKGSDLVPYNSEKVVATPDMCFSCHDGSVRDSRTKRETDFAHKIDVVPPSHMKIPEIFPLDENGKVQCATCHTAHGVPSGKGAKETIFMRVSNKNSAMCIGCHSDKTGGGDTRNHPMGSMKQKIPAELISSGAIAGNALNQVICETCHSAHGSRNETLLIDGAGDSGLCLKCHRGKNSSSPDGKRKPSHVINVPAGKLTVPKALLDKGAKLGYKGTITCQTCHKVHNNGIEKQLLLIKKDNRSTLCLTCHREKKYLKNTKHNLARTAPNEKNLGGKTVAESGICTACHLPHSPARKLSGEGDFTTQLCLSCHAKGNVAEKAMIIGTSHPLAVNPQQAAGGPNRRGSKSSLPLFNKFGVRDVNGNIACATCHDPHGSKMESDRIASSVSLKSNMDLFLRTQGEDICRECHSDKHLMANTKHDLRKSAPETTNILGMTPSASGLCGSCHLVHGGQTAFLWARQLNTHKNNSFKDICISCHNEQGIAGKRTIKDYSHPVNISPTERGLATTLPLFDENGNVSPKGDMTCFTCHDPHRGEAVRMDAEGNRRSSFLRLPVSSAPELCGNCHPNKASIEKTDHDLRVTAPDSKNIMNQTPGESGVCGVCHLVHNSENWARLWARNFGTGESLMDMMCKFSGVQDCS